MATLEPTDGSELKLRLSQRVKREWLYASIFLIVITFSLSFSSEKLGLNKLDLRLYDYAMSIGNTAPENPEIVIVTIDDSSIEYLGHWPWRRQHHAELLEILSDAHAITIDLLFSESSSLMPDDDAALVTAVKNNGKVFLPSKVSLNPPHITEPFDSLATASMAIGHINIPIDEDGVVRSFQPKIKVGSDISTHIIVKLLKHLGYLKNEPVKSVFDGYSKVKLTWSGAPGTFTMVPYYRVIKGDLKPSFFKDKLVLVGAWSSGLGDSFPTPVSQKGLPMAGVEILANILNNGINGLWVIEPGILLGAFLNIIPVLMCVIALRLLSPNRAFIFVLIVLIGCFSIPILLLHLSLLWISPIGAIIGVILSYPVWSWRSQQAALFHIDTELELLNNDIIGATEGHNPARIQVSEKGTRRPLTQRLGALHQAIEQSRNAHRQRDDAIRFLSHDMRSPLNSILALCEINKRDNSLQEENDTLNQCERYASQTLSLVDGFVELSRAQGSTWKMHEFDVNQSLQQSAEDAWATAMRKQIKIVVNTPEKPCWMHGEQQFIERVFINLINNAIQYSPIKTTITCNLQIKNNEYVISIHDQGYGMDENTIENAFVPFKRSSNNKSQHPTGVGLGLAFVQTVISRHSGRINIESEIGKGTKITLYLPSLSIIKKPQT